MVGLQHPHSRRNDKRPKDHAQQTEETDPAQHGDKDQKSVELRPSGDQHRPQNVVGAADQQKAENQRVVHDAWRLHYQDVRRSLVRGYYQGWDLNPAQLPTRYAAVFAFFLESLGSAQERLRNFVDQAAKATLMGSVFDDAATGQGLSNFFLRGLNCGAITEDEAAGTGLTVDEIRLRSFAKILEGRASAR